VGVVIGCDLGSQSVKAVVVDAAGRTLSGGSAPLDIDYPQPGWAEQDAGEWLRAIGQVVRQARVAAGVGEDEVEAIGFASQVDGAVAVDDANRPLAPAIIWMDRRATHEAEALAGRIDASRMFRLTGLNLDAYHAAPKFAWLRATLAADRRPSPDAFLLPGAFVVASLTGERLLDHSNASSTMLYDVARRAWCDELLEAVEIPAGQLGAIAEASVVAGQLTPTAASALGLSTTCRVVVGCGDEHGACLGAGVLGPGAVCDITGTAEPVAAATDRPVFDDTRLVETHAHAAPRTWLIENPGFVSGGSTRWLAELLGTAQEALPALAAEVPPGSDGLRFIPALSGSVTPRWNGHARGVFSGLALSHGRSHLARAVFEGCTFALRDLVDRLADLGLAGDEVRVVGGGARSPFWLQLKADVTGRVVRVVEASEATAVGAAMLAGVGVGHVRDLDEAAAAMVRLSPTAFGPDPRVRDVYDGAYHGYRALFDAVEPTFGATA
jgi:xylulokinase